MGIGLAKIRVKNALLSLGNRFSTILGDDGY